MTVKVSYTGAATLRTARLGLHLEDAGLDVDVYLVDQLAAALRAEGVVLDGGIAGTVRLCCEFTPEPRT